MDKKIISAGLPTYIIASLIWGVPSGICLAGVLKNFGSPGTVGAFAIIIAYGIFLYSWIMCIKIELNDKCITYRELFKRQICIRLEDIESVEGLSINKLGKMTSCNKEKKLPPMRLIIHESLAAGGRRIVINTKVLDRSGIEIIQDFLRENAD